VNNIGEVVISAEKNRSQLQNKEAVVKKLELLLEKAFFIPIARKPTKPSKSSIKKRLDAKKRHSLKKKLRKDPD
jgi:ribosome-associated protein